MEEALASPVNSDPARRSGDAFPLRLAADAPKAHVSDCILETSRAVLRKTRGAHEILGFAPNDGTLPKSLEIQIDRGPGIKQRSLLRIANIRGSSSRIDGRRDARRT